MSLLFETIRLKDGALQNTEYHHARLNFSRKSLFQLADEIVLKQHIQIPAFCMKGLFKCRVMYGKEIESVEFELYVTRNIGSLRLINDNAIDYSFKYTNRDSLNQLLKQKGQADEILIIKNGFITDTSFSNIIFFDGNKWFTPSTPLLRGTMRSYLMESNQISEVEITVSDLKHFKYARLINAMNPLDDGRDIEMRRIGW